MSLLTQSKRDRLRITFIHSQRLVIFIYLSIELPIHLFIVLQSCRKVTGRGEKENMEDNKTTEMKYIVVILTEEKQSKKTGNRIQ